MSMWDIFGGTTEDVSDGYNYVVPSETPAGYAPSIAWLTAPAPQNLVSLPSVTSSDQGWLSSVGSLFSSSAASVSDAASNASSWVGSFFKGSTAPNSAANTSASTGGQGGMLASVSSLFTGAVKAVSALKAATDGPALLRGTGKLVGKGVGGTVENFGSGFVGGLGLPTLLLIGVVLIAAVYFFVIRRA